MNLGDWMIIEGVKCYICPTWVGIVLGECQKKRAAAV